MLNVVCEKYIEILVWVSYMLKSERDVNSCRDSLTKHNTPTNING